jgi:hypothetical protein
MKISTFSGGGPGVASVMSACSMPSMACSGPLAQIDDKTPTTVCTPSGRGHVILHYFEGRLNAIVHVITHSMHHRARLLYMLRRLGPANLPEGDVLSWASGRPAE